MVEWDRRHDRRRQLCVPATATRRVAACWRPREVDGHVGSVSGGSASTPRQRCRDGRPLRW
ncbi:hypothetical protein FOA52_015650 [Chlamydomonas sp. UWO 241]|nr:hypothetical protein FOA52_015650 [Chlamydomonas sp. UWO 241]